MIAGADPKQALIVADFPILAKPTSRGKRLVYFGGWKGFCSVYGLPGGTMRLEFGEPIPGDVAKLIRARAAEIA